jgi:hypothetical protein
MMKSKLLKIIAKSALALCAALAVSGAPRLPGTVQAAVDIPSLYAEIAGGYEFYLGQQYLVISVSLDRGKLWMRAPGDPKAQELQSIDLAGLRFKIDDPGKEQYAVFVRNPDGRISSCRLLLGETEVVGDKIPAGGRAPRLAESQFIAGDLRGDLLQIRRALEEMHPAVHAFIPKEAFERLYEEQLGRIDGPMTLREFYWIAATLVAAVGCGHTRLSTPNEYWLTAPGRFFPLGVKFIGGRAYVTRATDPAGVLPEGSEITSINGRSVSDILKDLKSLVSSDGLNDGWKTARINDVFPTLYALRFGFPEEFIVQALPLGRKKAEEVRFRAVERSKIPADSPGKGRATSSGDPNLDFEILPQGESTAVLTIRAFDYYQARDKFKGFIDDSFDRIRRTGVQNLILDLRGNGGGDPFCTTHLLSYLEPMPIPYFARVYPDGYERFAEPIPRAAGAFAGKLFILINGRCFSSTGHFCALLKYHKIGTFIGTETGGTYECNDASREIHLNNTRLRLFVARMTFTAAVRGMPRYQGVVPDFVAEPSIADQLSGKDPAKEIALSLIARSGASPLCSRM